MAHVEVSGTADTERFWKNVSLGTPVKSSSLMPNGAVLVTPKSKLTCVHLPLLENENGAG